MAADTRVAKPRGLAGALSLTRLGDVTLQRLLTAKAGSPRDRLLRGAKALYRRSQMAADNVLEFQDVSEHEKMLADRVRVDTYERGIRAHIRPGDVVVDLGTGTGVLAILASRIARKVYAVDRAEIIEVAKHVARHHGVTNIEFVKVDSRYFSPREKVDVILHEQIGDELYDENIVENVTDLRDRILKPGGRIVPARFELYLEPVKVKDAFSVPFMWQMQLHGIDFGCVKEFAPAAGTALTRRWDVRWLNRLELDYLLCRPEPICRLDLSSAGARDLPHGVTVTKRVVHAGRLDGLFMYVKVIFDEETWLETSAEKFAPSWGNRFFRLPVRPLEAGDALELDITMPDVRRVRTWDVSVR